MNFGSAWAWGYATTLPSGRSGLMLRCQPRCSLGPTTTISRFISDWDRHFDASIHENFSLGARHTGLAGAVAGRRAADLRQYADGPHRHREADLSIDRRRGHGGG